jgi:hypothetical protein
MSKPTFVSTLAALAIAAAALALAPAAALACTPQTCGQGGGGGGSTDRPITLSVGVIQGTEGSPLGSGFASFDDPDPQSTASQFSATADWGDGSSGPVTVTETGANPSTGTHFDLVTNHAYHYSGTFAVCVRVSDVDNVRSSASACGTAQIAEAAMSVRGITDALTNPYCDVVAAISDANPYAWVGDFTATIDWGDRTTSAGTVVDNPNGGPDTPRFWVQACHTYGMLGPHTVITTVADDDIQMTASSTAWVYAFTDGGTFVVGDGNAALGGAVQFWGAGWANANNLSAGPAPDAFKGFAPGRSPICVGSWSAHPGDSSAPPATVPAYTAVLVSSDITRDEAQISGNSIHIALVRTDAGYGPSPDSPGTATVVYMIC